MDFQLAYFVDQLINGVTLGSIYGLIAIGYTMVYGIIGMINFAHGEIFMIGTFLTVIFFMLIIGTVTFFPLAVLVVLLLAVLLTSVYGWTLERVAYRPLQGLVPRLAPLISAIGMSIVPVQNYGAEHAAGCAQQAAEAGMLEGKDDHPQGQVRADQDAQRRWQAGISVIHVQHADFDRGPDRRSA